VYAGETADHDPGRAGLCRAAVIDIGTNSTRLLVADVDDDRVTELDRRTAVTRLGRGLGLSGSLSSEAIEDVCGVVAEYVDVYEQLGAETIAAVATSAVRDAANGDAFIAELRERFSLGARILDGAQEARLTYRGATAQRRERRSALVIDIGGGSTELVVGSGTDVDFHASLQAGVVRFSERHLSSDPPTPAELEALAGETRGLIDDAITDLPATDVEIGIAVAGTPTSLAAIELELDPYDAEQVHGHQLAIDSIQQMLSRLASLSGTERRAVIGLDPDRAPTIVAGVVILIEVMRAFGLDAVEASEHDILHGAALEAAHARNPK
jgi:exopolyphosphatase / guanosine-5'-triphosphate,3'-diphosphate pyrophosphatase